MIGLLVIKPIFCDYLHSLIWLMGLRDPLHNCHYHDSKIKHVGSMSELCFVRTFESFLYFRHDDGWWRSLPAGLSGVTFLSLANIGRFSAAFLSGSKLSVGTGCSRERDVVMGSKFAARWVLVFFVLFLWQNALNQAPLGDISIPAVWRQFVKRRRLIGVLPGAKEACTSKYRMG